MSRRVGESIHRCVGSSFSWHSDLYGFYKIGDFEAAPQERLNEGKGLEASRATKFLSYLAAKLLSNLATWRLIA